MSYCCQGLKSCTTKVPSKRLLTCKGLGKGSLRIHLRAQMSMRNIVDGVFIVYRKGKMIKKSYEKSKIKKRLWDFVMNTLFKLVTMGVTIPQKNREIYLVMQIKDYFLMLIRI